jgi:hypothetical protein
MADPVSTENSEEALRARARERIASGDLPRAKPARSWGGHGSGLPCSLCDQPIADTCPEMELEFDGAISATALRFHLQCQVIWDSARRMATESEWTTVEKRVPPFDTVVEARVNLSGSRSVILGVVLTRSRTPDGQWLNATTSSPLPAAWRPLEWRYPAGLDVSHQHESATPKRA